MYVDTHNHKVHRFIMNMQLNLQHDLLRRCDHTLTAIALAPGLTEVVMFGGDTRTSQGSYRPVAETYLFTFGKLIRN